MGYSWTVIMCIYNLSCNLWAVQNSQDKEFKREDQCHMSLPCFSLASWHTTIMYVMHVKIEQQNEKLRVWIYKIELLQMLDDKSML